jgi:hypothetical protein
MLFGNKNSVSGERMLHIATPCNSWQQIATT